MDTAIGANKSFRRLNETGLIPKESGPFFLFSMSAGQSTQSNVLLTAFFQPA
jgi:hypothetical protein